MDIKNPKIGQLREVGHFENNSGRVAYTAGYLDGYSSIITSVRCKIWQVNTKRNDEYGQIQIVSSWNMICRFQSAIDSSITLSSKFIQNERRFTIHGFSKINERDNFYHFVLSLSNA